MYHREVCLSLEQLLLYTHNMWFWAGRCASILHVDDAEPVPCIPFSDLTFDVSKSIYSS